MFKPLPKPFTFTATSSWQIAPSSSFCSAISHLSRPSICFTLTEASGCSCSDLSRTLDYHAEERTDSSLLAQTSGAPTAFLLSYLCIKIVFALAWRWRRPFNKPHPNVNCEMWNVKFCHPFSTHGNKRTTDPQHPSPMWPEAWRRRGRVRGQRATRGQQEMTVLVAPRSWPQHPSTFHFSLSLRTLTPSDMLVSECRAPHFYSFTSQSCPPPNMLHVM